MTNNNTMENVTEMIKSSENRNLDQVINNDIYKQQDDFKKKLVEKRRKSALSEIVDTSSLNKSVIKIILKQTLKKIPSNIDLSSNNFWQNSDNQSSNEMIFEHKELEVIIAGIYLIKIHINKVDKFHFY